jgi:hypothetical protein
VTRVVQTIAGIPRGTSAKGAKITSDWVSKVAKDRQRPPAGDL